MRRTFLDYFQAQRLDALLSAPLGLPAVPHLASQKLAVFSCAISFLWNNYNCPVGTLPVTVVRKTEEVTPRTPTPTPTHTRTLTPNPKPKPNPEP